jgi:hypothetical protein
MLAGIITGTLMLVLIVVVVVIGLTVALLKKVL